MPSPKPTPKKSEAVKSQETMKQKPKETILPKKIKPKATGNLTGNSAIEQYKKETSPGGIARAEADARAALEKKYPGLYLPQTRTTPGVRRP